MNAATTWGNGFCLVKEFKAMLFQNVYPCFRSFLILFRAAQFIACSLNCIPLPSAQLNSCGTQMKTATHGGLDFLFSNLLKSYKIIKFLPYENVSTNAPVLWNARRIPNGLDFSSKLWCICTLQGCVRSVLGPVYSAHIHAPS